MIAGDIVSAELKHSVTKRSGATGLSKHLHFTHTQCDLINVCALITHSQSYASLKLH